MTKLKFFILLQFFQLETHVVELIVELKKEGTTPVNPWKVKEAMGELYGRYSGVDQQV